MKLRLFIILTMALTTIQNTSIAANKNKTWTSPEAAASENQDFLIQGEYAEEKPEKGPYGVQVVALGKQTFDAYILEGGLPGAGWDKTKSRIRISGKTTDGTTTFNGEAFKAVIADKKLTLEKDGKKVATLKRIERKSPTLGKKPPKGAIVLFDGKNADAWEKGRMTDDGLLIQGTSSKQKFGSHTIHLEFRTPFKPNARDQARGNSGHYVQGRYETQILDSFGLEGKVTQTGGIYGIAAPTINMCFPPLTWQTYDVDFIEPVRENGRKVKHASMTVRLNGVLIHDDVKCSRSTTASKLKESDSPGPVYLQDHGNPVRFRNIWVVENK